MKEVATYREADHDAARDVAWRELLLGRTVVLRRGRCGEYRVLAEQARPAALEVRVAEETCPGDQV